MTKPKLPLINETCVVYEYKCDLCDAGYVGKTMCFRESLSSAVRKVVVPRSTVDIQQVQWMRYSLKETLKVNN